MRLAVLIPTRGDRPKFLENCFRMLSRQTLKPELIKVMDYPPTTDKYDITQRYRLGYYELRGQGFDLIAFIEDDDYYAPHYLETMVAKWNELGQPSLIGTGYTYYYHIKLRAWYKMIHAVRASMMNTMIKPDLDFPWCHDQEPYTDMHLWSTVRPTREIWIPEKPIAIGIKHNVGLCGGGDAHSTDAQIARRYLNLDANGNFLREHLDQESFEFYWNYFNQHTQ